MARPELDAWRAFRSWEPSWQNSDATIARSDVTGASVALYGGDLPGNVADENCDGAN